MLTFLLLDENIIFTICLGLFIAIGILEITTTFFGAALSGFFDSVSFDFDSDSAMDLGSSNILKPISIFIKWLNADNIPLLILIILMLFSFGISGIAIQLTSLKISGNVLKSYHAAAAAVLPFLLVTKYSAKFLSKILPSDETEAVSENSFIGKEAVIIQGTATKGNPAQAKFNDNFGTTHYIMIEPDAENHKFYTGDKVLIVEKNNAIYKGHISDIQF